MLIDKYIRRHRGPNVAYSRGTESVVDKSADHAKSLWVFFNHNGGTESVVDKSKDHAKSLRLFLATMEAQSPMSIRIQTTLNHCGFLNHDVDVK